MILMKLIVEYEGPKIRIYVENLQDAKNRIIIFMTDLNFALQTTLDGGVFLQIWNMDYDICFNFDQKGSLIFLERLLECKCFYTYAGDLWGNEELTKYCDEIFIDMEPDIQEIWDLREDMLYWLSYGV